MTDSQRTDVLERQIAQLETRVRQLESRALAAQPLQPWPTPWPIDWMKVTCGTAHKDES